MRRTIFCLAIGTIATLSPAWASADENTDRQAAQKIAATMRNSGKMRGYSVGVKCKDGTVWLAGHVTSSEQMNTALQLVSDMQGVEQIVNNLSIAAATPAPVDKAPVNAPPVEAAQTVPQPVAQPAAQPAPQFAVQPVEKVEKAPAKSPQAVVRGIPGLRSTIGAARNPAIQQTAANLPIEESAKAAMPSAAANQQFQGQRAPAGYTRLASAQVPAGHPGMGGQPIPAFAPGVGARVAPAAYDQAHMPNHAWPSYAAYPNYAAVTYPKQYSPTAWPYIGPFYPYPQVPMGWRKVTLQWDDGWWFLDFDDHGTR